MIKVLFFAHLQEVVGVEKIDMDIAPMTILEFKQRLKEEYGFTNIEQIMFAINEEYATNDDTINTGDTVALIPPVSGG
jgi:sulfur-carrier protein